ncbi:MAG: hypothetical protein AVDCRST_MAG87-13 [uncultured Thermomicrobiales bacterium]|uniref:Uncharacterized protein n=1 Tax=uncultured Thermomicrobiales bacterium TaxID=1645740 RepID=A0A6J4U6G7_9BACT|nr:MAG: hypothetical protein AVDCRST_MAG87-13 [uncultured Thermomicrobiales bacterium]
MVQKIGAQYLAKRFADQLMASPEPREEPEEVVRETTEVSGDLDGQIFHDEEGQPIGRAYLVRQVEVYVVSPTRAGAREELVRCLNEPDSRVYLREVDGRLSGVVYTPDPARTGERTGAMRADDV